MNAISDLPMLNDVDADYSPQHVKLARLIRGKIMSGEYKRRDAVRATDLAGAHGVSRHVASAALVMLAANRYISRQGNSGSHRVTWDAGHGHPQGHK